MDNKSKITLIDFEGNELVDDRLEDPVYLEVAKNRVERIAERHIAHVISIEDALAHAYLQGVFDVTLIDGASSNEKPAAQVIRPTGIKSKIGFGNEPKKKCH